MKYKYIFISIVVFLFNLHQGYGLDKDEYFADLYNHLYAGDYSDLEIKAEVAIEAWRKRVTRAEELSSSWRPSIYSHSSSKVSPEDEAAAKLGKDYCDGNLKYWMNRRDLIHELNKRIKYYELNVLRVLDNCDELIQTFPKYSAEMASDYPTQEKLALLKYQTKTVWEESLKELKASFFRTIKAERSQLMCENNGYLLGSIYAGIASAYRKSARIYNWEDSISDTGKKFDEYLKIHDTRFVSFKEVYKYLFIQNSCYPLEKRQTQLLEFLNLVNTLENEEK